VVVVEWPCVHEVDGFRVVPVGVVAPVDAAELNLDAVDVERVGGRAANGHRASSVGLQDVHGGGEKPQAEGGVGEPITRDAIRKRGSEGEEDEGDAVAEHGEHDRLLRVEDSKQQMIRDVGDLLGRPVEPEHQLRAWHRSGVAARFTGRRSEGA